MACPNNMGRLVFGYFRVNMYTKSIDYSGGIRENTYYDRFIRAIASIC